MSPTNLAIAEASARIRSGNLSPVDLVRAYRERIDSLDGELRAWAYLNDEAEDDARRLAAELSSGRYRGPLHGIPIGVKDIFDVAGMPTKCGSRVFLQDNVPTEDAECVRRLREAGAVFLGKTVTTEFAGFDPAVTRNPWKPRAESPFHTPGGSSSGSAAGVAARMCPAALGSQTGGSVTRPAAYCGVVGIKPTYGRTSVRGVFPIAYSLDHPGTLARTVADAVLITAAMWGPDPLDPFSSPDPAPDLPDGAATSPPTIGIPTSFFFERADSGVETVVREALTVLQAAGASVVDVDLPRSFGELHRAHATIMAAEAAEVHAERFRRNAEGFRPNVRSMVARGLALNGVDYAAAGRHRMTFRQEMAACFADVDVLLTPATPSTAPEGLLSTGDPVFSSPWSHSGHPTVSLPCGFAENAMPVGLQLVGPFACEPILFSAAAWCEAALHWDARPQLAL